MTDIHVPDGDNAIDQVGRIYDILTEARQDDDLGHVTTEYLKHSVPLGKDDDGIPRFVQTGIHTVTIRWRSKTETEYLIEAVKEAIS